MKQVHMNGQLDAALTGGALASTEWLGDSGQGGNGDWNTGADWNGTTVPGASGSVTFATGDVGYTVTGDATIGAITVNGDGVTFDGAISQDSASSATFLTALNGASVDLDSNAFFQGGALSFQDGTLLSVEGTLITSGGTADVITVDAEGGQIIASSAITLNQLYVQNGGGYAGDLNLNAGGNVTLDTASSFGGGTLTLAGSGEVFAGDAATGGGFVGVGENVVTGAAGAALALGASSDVTLGVSGVISGNGYVLINSGNVELEDANTYTGGTVVQDANLQVDGAGATGSSGVIFLSDGGFTAAGSGPYSDTVVAGGTSDTVNAGVGNLLVYGSQSGVLTYIGGTASTTVVGGAGVLDATGGSAGSSNTGGGTEQVLGDLIFGGTSGADTLQGGLGATTVGGGIGGTLIAQGDVGQLLAAGGGTTTLIGSAAGGNDTLFGGGAGSQVYVNGGTGVDTVILGAGNADIYSGTGTLDVYGGSGTFNLDFLAGFPAGLEKVSGFNVSTDKINLIAFASGAAAQVLANEQVSGGNTVLNLGNGAEVVLFGVTGLTANNFT
jgi:hypothetical protein